MGLEGFERRKSWDWRGLRGGNHGIGGFERRKSWDWRV
jgi:hypothetical protein